jgi:hypothetical protein
MVTLLRWTIDLVLTRLFICFPVDHSKSLPVTNTQKSSDAFTSSIPPLPISAWKLNIIPPSRRRLQQISCPQGECRRKREYERERETEGAFGKPGPYIYFVFKAQCLLPRLSGTLSPRGGRRGGRREGLGVGEEMLSPFIAEDRKKKCYDAQEPKWLEQSTVSDTDL